MYRNKEIKIRLTEKELARLDRNVARSRMSREGYMRFVLSGYEPQANPPEEFYVYLRGLRTLCGDIDRCRYELRQTHPEQFEALSKCRKTLGSICDDLQSMPYPKKSETQKAVI